MHTTDRATGPEPLKARRAASDRGAALVEFALLLPFLAILVFGTVDLGRGFQMKNRLTNAAREGAFYGQYHPCDTAGIAAAVAREDPGLASLNGYAVNTTVAGGCPSPTAGGNLVVTVSVGQKIITPFVAAVTGSTVTVKGAATVVVQG